MRKKPNMKYKFINFKLNIYIVCMFCICVTFLLYDYILCVCMCVIIIICIYLNSLCSFFHTFPVCWAGVFILQMMQWSLTKMVYQEGNLLRYKDLDTTVCFGLIKQVNSISGKLWKRTPIAHTTSVNKVVGSPLRWKMAGWCLHLTFYKLLCCFEASCGKNPGFITIREKLIFCFKY